MTYLEVRKKESTFKTINDSFKRLREDSLDDVGMFRITVRDAETEYADKPFKMEGIEYTPSRVKGTKNYHLIYGHEFGEYFDDDEVLTILARPGDIYIYMRLLTGGNTDSTLVYYVILDEYREINDYI